MTVYTEYFINVGFKNTYGMQRSILNVPNYDGFRGKGYDVTLHPECSQNLYKMCRFILDVLIYGCVKKYVFEVTVNPECFHS